MASFVPTSPETLEVEGKILDQYFGNLINVIAEGRKKDPASGGDAGSMTPARTGSPAFAAMLMPSLWVPLAPVP